MLIINGQDPDGLITDIDEHIHGPQLAYPTLANGVTVTGGAAWTLGNYAEIVPINTITSAFCIEYLYVEDVSADDTYELVLYQTTTEVGRARFTRDVAAASTEPLIGIPFHTDLIPANSQVQAKIASSSGGDNAVVSIAYQLH